MARPRKEGLDYFPFDVDMDDEFKALEELHGNDGFVWLVKFWQAAYKTSDGFLSIDGIHGVIRAKTSRISTEKQRDILKDCLELKLLFEKNKKYTSNGIQKRLEKVNAEREKDRKRAKNGLSNGKLPENNPKTPGKGGKEKKRKVVFIPPSFEEFNKYCIENGFGSIAERAFKGYQAGEWHDAQGKKIHSWKQKLQNGWFKNDNKDQDPNKPTRIIQ